MGFLKRVNWEIFPFYVLVVGMAFVHVPFLNASVFSAPKLLLLRLVVLGLLGMWAFKMFVSEKIQYRKSWFNLVLWVWMGAGILSTIFSDFFWSSLLGVDGRFIGVFTLLSFGLLSFFAFNAFKDEREVKRVLRVSFVVAVLTAVYGVLQGQTWFDELTMEVFKWGFDPTDRVFATFGHSTHFAAYLGMHIPIGLMILWNRKDSMKIRIAIGLGLALMLWAILASGSRGGLGAVLVVVGVSVIYRLSTIRRGGRVEGREELGFSGLGSGWRWKRGLMLLVGVLVLGWVIVGFLGDKIAELQTVKRTQEIFEWWEEGKITDRQSWWISSWEMWKDRPILGHGLSTYADSYNKYRRLDYRVPGDAQDYIVPHTAHMEFLNILATEGIVGLLSYLFFLGFVFYVGIMSRNETVFVLLIGFLGYLLHSMLSFGVVSTLTFVYLFVGMAMGIVGGRLQNLGSMDGVRSLELGSGGGADSRRGFDLGFRFGGLKVLGVLLGALVCVGIIFSVRHYAADVMKQRALGAEFGEDEAYFRAAIRLNPYEYSYYLDFGDELLKKGQISEDIAFAQQKIKQALKNYEMALKINDAHPIVYNHTAIAYSELLKLALENGDIQNFEVYYEKAVENHKIAVEKGPNNPVYLYDLASFFYKHNKNEEALELFHEVEKMRPGFKAVRERMGALGFDPH